MKDTLLKLTKCDKAWKSAETSIESSKRQAREQLRHLRKAEGQLTIAWTKITDLTKELEQKAEEMSKAKQAAYDLRQKETATHLKSQIPTVCRDFYL